MKLLEALLNRTRPGGSPDGFSPFSSRLQTDLRAPIQSALHLSEPVPERQYRFPLVDHGRRLLEPLVRIGDTVVTGQALAEGIVCSVEGTVEQIDAQPFAHPSNLPILSVTVRAELSDPSNTAHHRQYKDDQAGAGSHSSTLTTEQLHRCGVNGLGGAGYSAAQKLSAAKRRSIHTLIINAAECDPDIRCDEALMVSEPDSVVRGIVHLMDLTQCQNCIVAMESDKQDAINALRNSLQSTTESKHRVPVELRLIEPAYPSGAERILIRLVCGVDVVPPSRPAEHGVLCVNVATAEAAGKAAEGHAQTTRIVTIAGPAAAKPCNARVRLGTTLAALIRSSGNHYDPEHHRLRIGGSISGFELRDVQAPVTATTNCITIEERLPKAPAMPCIRCGKCSDVCPVHLLPQQLYWHAQADDLEAAGRLRVDHCIECACCDLVCPSGIELTNLFRHARSQRRALSQEQSSAELARQRHESHTRRLAVHEAQAQEQIRMRKSALNDRAAASAAALERVRKRRKRPPS